MNYSIIIPLYNEELNIVDLHKELIEVINKNTNSNRNFELIYIDDGSIDNTFEKLKNFNKENFQIKIIKNKTNLSQSISIYNGINNSIYDNLIF